MSAILMYFAFRTPTFDKYDKINLGTRFASIEFKIDEFGYVGTPMPGTYVSGILINSKTRPYLTT